MKTEKLCGVWSAAPTPFTADFKLDEASIERLATHHDKLKIKSIGGKHDFSVFSLFEYQEQYVAPMVFRVPKPWSPMAPSPAGKLSV